MPPWGDGNRTSLSNKVPFFDRLKIKHGYSHTWHTKNFVNNTEHNKLGQYLTEAFEMRKKQIEFLQQR